MIKHILLTVFLISAISLNGSQRCSPYLKVYNPGSSVWKESASGWAMTLDSRKIYEWGRSRGIYLIEDRGPVVDGTAAYVSSTGSKIVLDDIKRGCFYRIWIDFVSFRLYGDKENAEQLKIFMGTEDSGYSLIETVKNVELDSRKQYYLDIPYGMTINNRLEIIFGDYSTKNGFWGIWDIIISTGNEIPSQIDIPDKKKR